MEPMGIDRILEGVEEKGLYDIAYDILTSPGDYSDQDTLRIVNIIEHKRQDGWLFLMEFDRSVRAQLGIIDPKKNTGPLVMRSMGDYWEYVARRMEPTTQEIESIEKNPSCIDNMERLLADLFGKPGSPKHMKARMKQAENMPFNAHVEEGILRQPFMKGYEPRATVVLRHKTVPRTLEKIARKISELETVHKALYGFDSHPSIDQAQVKRHDALGMKIILYDERAVSKVNELLYPAVTSVIQQTPRAFSDVRVEWSDHYRKKSKKDNAIHVDLHFPYERHNDLEIILTSKYDFWIDEFCGEHSHHKYMFTAESGISKETLLEEHRLENINTRTFNKLNEYYKTRVQDLVARGNEFLSLVHRYAGPVLEDNIRYYFPMKW
jgi:hypothetical protein